MQMAAQRVFLTQDHRLALVWRLLSYLFLFMVVNLVANVARVVLQSVGVASVISRLVFGLESAAGWIRIVGFEGGTSALLLLVDSLLLSLAFGVCEELCFRGYLFQNLGESLPIWMAALLTGLIFCAFHVLEIGFDVGTLSFLLFILLLNVFLVLTRLLTQSLWLAISFHTVFDWGPSWLA
jgi:membrane protease YdiL (CAAX protease family)